MSETTEWWTFCSRYGHGLFAPHLAFIGNYRHERFRVRCDDCGLSAMIPASAIKARWERVTP